jgi:hypothetical protein
MDRRAKRTRPTAQARSAVGTGDEPTRRGQFDVPTRHADPRSPRPPPDSTTHISTDHADAAPSRAARRFPLPQVLALQPLTRCDGSAEDASAPRIGCAPLSVEADRIVVITDPADALDQIAADTVAALRAATGRRRTR